MSERNKDNKKERSKVKTFPVPFDLKVIQEDLTVHSNTPCKQSKEQIINQAFKFHSEGNIQEAKKYYQYFINQGFKDYMVFSNYGILLKKLGKSQEAELFTRKAIEHNPNFAVAHSNLGKMLKDLGKSKDAELSIRKAIELNPDDSDAHFNLGVVLQDLSNLKEAEISTRKAIELNPNYAEAHLNLGNILSDLGKLEEAEISTRQAIELKPDFAEAHSNLGNILSDLGKLEEAEISTRQAIELKPNYVDAHLNLGNILNDLGKLEEAEISTRQAIELKPNYVDAHLNLGNILNDLGKLEEAELSARKATELKPDYAEAYSNLGNILSDLGKSEEAELSARKATELKPDFAEAHSNLGNILSDLGKLEEAELTARKATELKPDFAEAHSYLGNILKDLGQFKEAELSQRKAIELNPDYADFHLNLGSILIECGNLEEAEISTRKAIELKSDLVEAHSNLGVILKDIGKLEEAKKEFEKSLEIEPKDIYRLSDLMLTLSKMCLWDEIEKYLPYSNKIGIEGKSTEPLGLMYLEDNPINHLKRAVNFNQRHRREELPIISHQNNNKIKIGYFSSDFRNHAITHLIIRILELHDKSKFDIYAYSLSNINDNYTNRVKDAVYCFREIANLSDLEIVQLARKDKIDIAIDLNGITTFNRQSIFSYKLAPIQINYLGYPGTIGSESFDYIIADKIVIPEKNKKFYTEKVLYLKNTLVPHDNTKEISSYNFSREELGLPSIGFIFTCFNNIQKITRKEFNIWIRLLKKVDKSILWLMKPNHYAIKNIHRELINQGLQKDRVVFAEKMNLDEHLSRHSCADLFLDTFNYNAGTTASDSLWAGLPLITMLGKSYSARMAASILSSCDLKELITHTESEYESLAYELATNKDKLKKIRNKLKNKEDLILFNSNNYTKELENIFITLVKSNKYI
ncbi:tetratricopeptide repeat protein [Prochlorococcus marinus]|uniref:tetratricopeptide repeat protein n=1 Tax=Prochlorococcus marinus TaxID=1219 RepID=UPI0022B4245B|nr:tetratricopeptide repeat protein [Prochlorococcus marinus]